MQVNTRYTGCDEHMFFVMCYIQFIISLVNRIYNSNGSDAVNISSICSSDGTQLIVIMNINVMFTNFSHMAQFPFTDCFLHLLLQFRSHKKGKFIEFFIDWNYAPAGATDSGMIIYWISDKRKIRISQYNSYDYILRQK